MGGRRLCTMMVAIGACSLTGDAPRAMALTDGQPARLNRACRFHQAHREEASPPIRVELVRPRDGEIFTRYDMPVIAEYRIIGGESFALTTIIQIRGDVYKRASSTERAVAVDFGNFSVGEYHIEIGVLDANNNPVGVEADGFFHVHYEHLNLQPAALQHRPSGDRRPSPLPAVDGLLNARFGDELIADSPWHNSHGARQGHLGAGLLYYTLAYTHRAQTAVCIGSGGGFVTSRPSPHAVASQLLGTQWRYSAVLGHLGAGVATAAAGAVSDAPSTARSRRMFQRELSHDPRALHRADVTRRLGAWHARHPCTLCDCCALHRCSMRTVATITTASSMSASRFGCL